MCHAYIHVCVCVSWLHTFVQDGEAMQMGGGNDVLSTGAGLSGDTHGLEDDQEDEDTPIFEKHDTLLHGERVTQKFLSSLFMKKYIHVARVMKPVLTREACDIISTEYTKLRAQDTSGTDKAKVSCTVWYRYLLSPLLPHHPLFFSTPIYSIPISCTPPLLPPSLHHSLPHSLSLSPPPLSKYTHKAHSKVYRHACSYTVGVL